MPRLEWIDDPGIKAQSNLGTVTYYVMFPSVQINLIDPSQSFSEPKLYMAQATKVNKDGMPVSYVVGHGFNNVQQATTACQEDHDRYGEAIPPGKEPPPPPPPSEMT